MKKVIAFLISAIMLFAVVVTCGSRAYAGGVFGDFANKKGNEETTTEAEAETEPVEAPVNTSAAGTLEDYFASNPEAAEELASGFDLGEEDGMSITFDVTGNVFTADCTFLNELDDLTSSIMAMTFESLVPEMTETLQSLKDVMETETGIKGISVVMEYLESDGTLLCRYESIPDGTLQAYLYKNKNVKEGIETSVVEFFAGEDGPTDIYSAEATAAANDLTIKFSFLEEYDESEMEMFKAACADGEAELVEMLNGIKEELELGMESEGVNIALEMLDVDGNQFFVTATSKEAAEEIIEEGDSSGESSEEELLAGLMELLGQLGDSEGSEGSEAE